MNGAEQLASFLRDAKVAGNSTDPAYYDRKATALDTIAVTVPVLAQDARYFAGIARHRATQLRAKRRR